MQVHLTTRPAPRDLADILTDARLTACGQCLQAEGLPCTTHPETGATGIHVARLTAAYRRHLISGADLIAALAAPDAFGNGTVIWTDAA